MLQPGISAEVKFVVTDELTAKTVGSGTLDVLATPVMIARLEQRPGRPSPPTWPKARAPWAPDERQAPQPHPRGPGGHLPRRADEVDGRRLVFKVTAEDAAAPSAKAPTNAPSSKTSASSPRPIRSWRANQKRRL